MLITHSQLLSVLSEADESYEHFGRRIGLSGMTLRRWLKKPSHKPLPLHCQSAVSVAVRQLVDEGRLDKNSAVAEGVISDDSLTAAENTMRSLGMSLSRVQSKSDLKNPDQESRQTVVDGLAQIGAGDGVIDDVTKHEKEILSFGAKSKDWKHNISVLLKTTKSRSIGNAGKLVAFGALFYLLDPIDLIPDYIVGFGLVDDFSVLAIAAVFCAKMLEAHGKS